MVPGVNPLQELMEIQEARNPQEVQQLKMVPEVNQFHELMEINEMLNYQEV